MGRIVFPVLAGVAPANAAYPKFKDAYPGWIPPGKVVNYSDNFNASGNLAGRVLPQSPSGAAWTGSPVLSTDDGGYAYTTSTLSSGSIGAFTAAGSGAKGYLLTRVRFDDAAPADGSQTAIGLLCRYADSNNYVRLLLSLTGLALEERVAGVNSTKASVAFAPTLGSAYDLYLEWNGSSARGYVYPVGDMGAGAGCESSAMTSLQANAGVGFYLLRNGCRMMELRLSVPS